jgi:AbrB family looped-hinge helix DNA binding protein
LNRKGYRVIVLRASYFLPLMEGAMASAVKSIANMSSKGQIVIPKAIRESKGFVAGARVEFVDHPDGVLLKQPKREAKYTLQDLASVLPRYEGPPVTEELIRERMEEAMRERWERKEKNSRSR